MATKPILVMGATGNQGGSTVDALLALPNASSHTLLAVTRNPSSSSAQKLAAKSPLVKIVQGDYADLPALFKSATAATSQPVWGVFSVQALDKPKLEEEQGKGLIDEALKNGVKHFVYSSVDRGGNEKSWSSPTDVPHFKSKHNIEQYLKSKAQGTDMTWTVLRPVAFFENLSPGFGMKVFMAALRDTLKDKPLQWISTADIGHYAAQSFASPAQFNQKAIGLAGDEMTYEQLQEKLRKVKGYDNPATFGFFGSALKFAVGEMGAMINWFKTDGYGVDIPALKREHNELMDFETWLEKRSPF